MYMAPSQLSQHQLPEYTVLRNKCSNRGLSAMLTSNQILDLLKAQLGSDYRTGKELNIPQPRVSRIRNSGGILNDEQGVKAAQILGLKEEFILLSLAAERAQNSPVYSILK